MVISLLQLVISVVLNVYIVSSKCCIFSASSMMCWDILLVMSYFY